MKNICIELLNSFTGKELIGFRNFLDSGIFYIDKKVYQLFNELNKYAIGKNNYNHLIEVRVYNIVLNESIMIQKLNTKQKKQLNSLTTALTRLAEDFIVYQELQKDYETKREVLYKVLLQKRQFKLLQKHLKSDKKKISALKKKTELQYRLLYQLENSRFNVMFQTGEPIEQDNLEQINENLDVYYILKKLSLWSSMLSLENATSQNYDYTSFKIVLDYINNTNYKRNPTIIIFLAIIELLNEKTENTYKNLLLQLSKYEDFVDREILIGAYNAATIFCSFSIKRGSFTHYHLLELYQTLDEKKLLLEGVFMPVNKLKNLVSVGCRTKQFGWCENILEKYIKYVNKQYRSSVYQFNCGVINFYQNKYNVALQNFIRVDDVNLVFDISYRIMTMKAHYEVDDSYDERTIQIFRSAEKYFAANKLISSNYRTAYKNFVRMLINLYRIKHKVTKMKTDSFIKKLKEQKFNQDKSWLIAKLEEI